MRLRAGNGPRNMTVKLLGCRDEGASGGESVSLAVDQLAVTLPTMRGIGTAISELERAKALDLAVAYDPYSMRDPSPMDDGLLADNLKRLGVIRGRPGIGYPAAVHLERCAAPARTTVTDVPQMAMLGGVGMLTLLATPEQIVETIATGTVSWRMPQVIQLILSGRLSASVSARDVCLELIRLGLRERVQAIATAEQSEVVLEFSGPGTRSLSVPERALLCSMAPNVGACAAIAACDEKTELFLRDQRRSKAYRQLAPDPGAPCSEVVCLDLSTVLPLIALGSGAIAPVAEVANSPIREVVIGGESSATLRDLLGAAAWFKTKRTSADVDVVIVPATRQVFESVAMNGTLAQLLSVGVRLLEPDVRLLDGQWHPPPGDGMSLRSFTRQGHFTTPSPNWAVASIDTLCMSAIAGSLQDPRATRKSQRVACPRELPIDDSLLFDRRLTLSATLPPPSAVSEKGEACHLTTGSSPDSAIAKCALGERQAWS